MSRALPPLNALRAFEAFARHGGMTAAAAELCVTHGAVSRAVRSLQQALGVSLVSGPRHRLVLTPVGVELAAQLVGAFAVIGEAVAVARRGAHRDIEISCLGTFALKWLIPRLPGFIEAHPEVRVRLSESHAGVNFARDRFDGAIRTVPSGHADPRQEATPFLPLYQGAVGAPSIAPAGLSFEALAGLPRLRAATFREEWIHWSERMGRTLAPARVEREFAHNHSMIEAAASGLGVAVTPWAFVEPDIVAGRLSAPFGFVRQDWSFAFLRPVDRPDPAVDAFRDWLVLEGRRTPSPLPPT